MVSAYSWSPSSKDEVRAKVEAGCDHFVDVSGAADSLIAERLRADRVDIAVDLMGYTLGARSGIFARHAAPIQISYLGYPGSTRAPWMDYFIADKWIAPIEHRYEFSEKLVVLPRFYLPFPELQSPKPIPSRAECGLPEKAFVFCCFNKVLKIEPLIFDCWMRVLNAVPESVLWLRAGAKADEGGREIQANLRREASARGVDPDRLIFAERVPLDKHLARHGHADLFLDTRYYGGHSTLQYSFWCGVPVVGIAGPGVAGRVSKSLFEVVDATKYIAATFEDYEALALSLATQPKELAAYRKKIRRIGKSKAFDNKTLVRYLEAAFEQACSTRRSGGEPQDILLPEKNAGRARL